MTINAHFDGKVIVPDNPVDLPLKQALILEIRPANIGSSFEAGSALDWLADHAVEGDALPSDLSEQHDRYLYGAFSRDAQS